MLFHDLQFLGSGWENPAFPKQPPAFDDDSNEQEVALCPKCGRNGIEDGYCVFCLEEVK